MQKTFLISGIFTACLLIGTQAESVLTVDEGKRITIQRRLNHILRTLRPNIDQNNEYPIAPRKCSGGVAGVAIAHTAGKHDNEGPDIDHPEYPPPTWPAEPHEPDPDIGIFPPCLPPPVIPMPVPVMPGVIIW